MNFECYYKNENWDGKITTIEIKNNYYEFWIISRTSFFTILGSTSRGNFICFPDFNLGCHLVNLKDKFWNREKLTEILGEIDGLTVASALEKLATEIQI